MHYRIFLTSVIPNVNAGAPCAGIMLAFGGSSYKPSNCFSLQQKHRALRLVYSVECFYILYVSIVKALTTG